MNNISKESCTEAELKRPALNPLIALILSIILFLTSCGSAAPTKEKVKEKPKQTTSQTKHAKVEPHKTEKKKDEEVKAANAEDAPTSRSKAVQHVSHTQASTSRSNVPSYSGNAYTSVNGNQPSFSSDELSAFNVERYSNLDSLCRCGVAFANLGVTNRPAPGEKRGSISHIKPSGWNQAKYDIVPGKWLYNRCHLIGWQLSAENDNRRNLVTGTRYMNINGMLPFENMVADYIKETGNHVAYKVSPIFEGSNSVCSGVQIEAFSVEDNGEGICFNVYCYNIQPGININYYDGSSSYNGNSGSTGPSGSQSNSSSNNNSSSSHNTAPTPPAPSNSSSSEETVYKTPSGKRYHASPTCGGKNSVPIDLDKAKELNLTPCKKCVH